MPNIFTCNPGWVDDLKNKEEKVVIATWSEKGGAPLNDFLEKLQSLEQSGVPVYVVDCDACKGIADKLGVKEAGETVVFKKGVEVGRMENPAANVDDSFAKVKGMVE
jgi:thioredoxin-like negative regulator of GroEL